MGSPEYPGDEQSHDITPPPSYALPMHGQNDEFDTDNESDVELQDIPYTDMLTNEFGAAGDNRVENQYPGAEYQLLGSGDIADGERVFSDDEDMDSDSNAQVNVDNPGLPATSTVETEVLRDIWNAPRPAELDIDIDAIKSEQIKSVMTNVSLKLENVTPPQWAQNIPETKWIEDLLQEVRKHKMPADALPKI